MAVSPSRYTLSRSVTRFHEEEPESLRPPQCAADREYAEAGQRDGRNVEIVLSAAMRERGALSGIRKLVACVEFLRDCFDRGLHRVTEVKAEPSGWSRWQVDCVFDRQVPSLRRMMPPRHIMFRQTHRTYDFRKGKRIQ